VAEIGLGLAALGRPAYITIGHARDVAGGYDAEVLQRRCHEVLDAAWAAGIRWFDVARSYGRAEEFLSTWLRTRSVGPGEVTVSSKWGYRYVADWRPDAKQHEVKDHSLEALDRQLAETRALLGSYLSVYQVHSATFESGILENRDVLDRLGAVRDDGLTIGLSLSGARQGALLERALGVQSGGKPLFGAVQATWNLAERSVAPALQRAKDAGLLVLVKEVLANGRLAGIHAPPALVREATRLGGTPDAVALAASLAQPFTDVALSGAATREQLMQNLRALELDGEDIAARLPELSEAPQRYWETRAGLSWN
jgi:aryl-alcohol dehydrogenase-like predicted oxidoreductase